MTVTGAGSRPRGSGWRVAAAALALLALAGCSVLPGPAVDGPDARPADAPGGAADEIIAAELSNVFANAFDPMTTTVQVPVRDDDAARAALVAALAGRGFGIQRVAADQGAHFLETERVVEAAEDRATRVLWRASIGPAEVRRDYTIAADGALYAASPIRLAGTRTDIRTADLERAEPMSVDPAYRRIEYVAPRTPADPAPVISLVTPGLVERVAREAALGATSRSRAPTLQALNADRVETGNLFYDAESNFGSTLDGLDRVDRRIVVFANDSLNLGPENRGMIRRFVEESVARDDLISLVGCSNGPTAAEIGNEGLALGRAERVAEELAALGIPRENVYDEGCWAPVSAGDRFPGRGVVIELWRAPA